MLLDSVVFFIFLFLFKFSNYESIYLFILYNFRGFATAASKPDQNLERSLKRLDQDVR